MRPDRKAARDYVKSIKTREDLKSYLNMLNLSDDEIEIAMLLFGRGFSKTQIAMTTGFSEHQVKRKIDRIYSKMV